MGEVFAALQRVLATLHRLHEAGFFFEIARQNILHQLIGLAALLDGGVRQLRFEFGCDVYFHRLGSLLSGYIRSIPRMKFIDEYRDPKLARALVAEIAATVTRPWVLMEICGGQTHTLMRYGIDELLPRQLELVHGPGCPVCVTPLEIIDRAISIAAMPGVTLVSYGDMLRVPGSASDLFRVKRSEER